MMKFHDLLSPHGMHACMQMHGVGKKKQLRFSKILEISIFKFIFGISFKNKQFKSKHDHVQIHCKNCV